MTARCAVCGRPIQRALRVDVWTHAHPAGPPGHPAEPRRSDAPMSYDDLMWALSHCDDCGCPHDRPVPLCRCVCHATA